jgi:hypothetical protein
VGAGYVLEKAADGSVRGRQWDAGVRTSLLVVDTGDIADTSEQGSYSLNRRIDAEGRMHEDRSELLRSLDWRNWGVLEGTGSGMRGRETRSWDNRQDS